MTDTVELRELRGQLADTSRELSSTRQRLQSANLELEQFAYIAAHELVAPLRAVALFAEVLEGLLSADDRKSDRAQACASEIRAGVGLMHQQVHLLLELSQTTGAVDGAEPIDPRDAAQAAADSLGDQMDDVAGQVTIEHLPEIVARKVPLQSVFAAMLANAIRYRDPSRSLRVAIRGSATDEACTITVRDNGLGVDAEDRHRIFQLFERASAIGAGSGMGLALSRRIVESFGGMIGVSVVESGGAEFWMTFPHPTVEAWTN